MNTYAFFFSGVGAVVIGALLTVVLTHKFQKALLEQQLDFEKQQAEHDAKLREAIWTEWRQAFKELRDTLNYRLAALKSHD